MPTSPGAQNGLWFFSGGIRISVSMSVISVGRFISRIPEALWSRCHNGHYQFVNVPSTAEHDSIVLSDPHTADYKWWKLGNDVL